MIADQGNDHGNFLEKPQRKNYPVSFWNLSALCVGKLLLSIREGSFGLNF